ncbi:MAG: hypothetical protein HDT39_09045 [Lachnospiraceae bacterium]|nr:hypothetical protein [Lachnospiraceae bacterium]
MEWTEYWKNFVKQKKLQDKVNEMNLIDDEKNNQNRIETICHDIYYDYEKHSKELEKIRLNLVKIVETFPEVYLWTSRVKKIDSLLEKVIIKRHKHLLDAKNLYSGINVDNYKNILTDLVGIRLIINYR